MTDNQNQNPSTRQFQDDLEQYKMPDALKQAPKATYNVGYEATTGNSTSPDHEIDKKN
ncbi:hypothetical protein JOC75_000328 [Metabacillus crassostreae]|uniref:hypothetical protein n=1 Tax=Metabacillus crassostreae TaxID=929098 RepID=UPI00195C06CC|nr:hypothetical protein [Metabacillus crassostreae]MBM7602358.1 hypothetical protein [Metabacillus crassostreae]